MSGHPGPSPMAHCRAVDEETTVRVRHYIARVGIVAASKRLHASLDTLNEARGRGRLRPATKARLLEALDREEAALEREAS